MIERLITKHKSRRVGKPEWIIVHYPGCLGTPLIICDSMAAAKKDPASTHYIVYEREIVHCVDEAKYYAWHCATKDKKVYCAATNRNSIGVDLIARKLSAKTLKAADKDWYFDGETMHTAATLIRKLMADYSIDISHVVRHYDVTHKLCPRPFTGNDINEHWRFSGNDAWIMFKHMIMG